MACLPVLHGCTIINLPLWMPGTLGHMLLGWNSHSKLPIIQDQTTTLRRENTVTFYTSERYLQANT